MDEPVLLTLPRQLVAERALIAGQAVDLADFADENWLMPGPETSCHELTRRACGSAGFVPRPSAVASDSSVLTELVAIGAGVALVPRMALPADTSNVSLHPLAHPVGRIVHAFTWTGDARLPHVKLVLEALRTVAADIELQSTAMTGR